MSNKVDTGRSCYERKKTGHERDRIGISSSSLLSLGLCGRPPADLTGGEST